MWTPHNTFAIDHFKHEQTGKHFSGYGLGWSVGDYWGNLRIGHTGGYDGMITAVDMLPDKKLGVIVLTNGMNSPIRAVTQYIYDMYLGKTETDWSTKMLNDLKSRKDDDKRVAEIKESRKSGTQPILEINKITGNYKSAIYGLIKVTENNGKLRLEFEHSPELSCTLEHWHYDVYKLNWETPQAWFQLGVVTFNYNDRLHVTGMDFNVPNNDIFFEELKPVRIN